MIRSRVRKNTKPPLRRTIGVALLICAGLLVAGCADSPPVEQAAGSVEDDARQVIARARKLIQEKDFAGATALLETLTDREPTNARAWMVLGYAWHAAGEYERAIPLHEKAAEFEETAPQAMYNAACSYARLGKNDEAFALLGRVRDTNHFDLTQITFDPDLESIKDDPRIFTLMPGPGDFDRPFVEPSRIVQEWRDFDFSDTARALILPVWLTVGFLPFIYVVALYSAYKDVLVRMSFASKGNPTHWRVCSALFVSFVLLQEDCDLSSDG